MAQSWQGQLIERLTAAVNDDGSWGYAPRQAGSSEPTALAILALAAHEQGAGERERAATWLRHCQQSSGAVTINPQMPAPAWPTALALLAWQHAGVADRADIHDAIESSHRWLLAAHGEPVHFAPEVFGHNTQLIGWSWVAGTHSWVEPTAYAILALRSVGEGQHPRVREGVALLFDRVLPDGGWNYGNCKVFGHTLRPFPATTGVALAAVAGESTLDRLEPSLEYLTSTLVSVRSPMSLAWGLIGLNAWDQRPGDADAWLEAAMHASARTVRPHLDALLLLAAADRCPFVVQRPEASHVG